MLSCLFPRRQQTLLTSEAGISCRLPSGHQWDWPQHTDSQYQGPIWTWWALSTEEAAQQPHWWALHLDCMVGWGQGLLPPPLGSGRGIAVCYTKPVSRMYASAFVLASLDTGLLQRKGVLFLILRGTILLASFLSALAKYPAKAA